MADEIQSLSRKQMVKLFSIRLHRVYPKRFTESVTDQTHLLPRKNEYTVHLKNFSLKK